MSRAEWAEESSRVKACSRAESRRGSVGSFKDGAKKGQVVRVGRRPVKLYSAAVVVRSRVLFVRSGFSGGDWGACSFQLLLPSNLGVRWDGASFGSADPI